MALFANDMILNITSYSTRNSGKNPKNCAGKIRNNQQISECAWMQNHQHVQSIIFSIPPTNLQRHGHTAIYNILKENKVSWNKPNQGVEDIQMKISKL